MFRILKYENRIAKTWEEKKLSMKKVYEIMENGEYVELFHKAKIHTMKKEYVKVFRVFEYLFQEQIEFEYFVSRYDKYFTIYDINEIFSIWEKTYKDIGNAGFYSCIGERILSRNKLSKY